MDEPYKHPTHQGYKPQPGFAGSSPPSSNGKSTKFSPWFFPLLHCFSAGQPDTLQMLTLQFTSLSSQGLGRRCWRFLERNCDRFIGSCKKCRLLLGITYTLYIYIYDTHNLYVYTVYQRHIRRTKYCVPFDFPLPSLLRTKFSRYLSLVLRKHEETPLKKT